MTNKRVIAHVAHLRNSFNHFFLNTLCKAMIIPYRCLIKNHYVLLMKWMFLICKTTVLFTQGCLWQDLLKIALIWSKRFSNFVKCIFAIPLIPGKGRDPSFEHKLAQWIRRRRWKFEKFKDRRTDRWTNGRRAIRKAKLSFQLRWPKK